MPIFLLLWVFYESEEFGNPIVLILFNVSFTMTVSDPEKLIA